MQTTLIISEMWESNLLGDNLENNQDTQSMLIETVSIIDSLQIVFPDLEATS